jgi:CubicO group peptidase (beta-lactamase class C family)
MILAGATCCRAADDVSSAKAAAIDKLASLYEEYGYFNGSILVAEHGGVIYSKGIGQANRQTQGRNTPHTKFGIASITKQFTAVLVLQQVEEGRIRLGASVSDYLAWYRKDTGMHMTVENLLHHTSGLPPDYDAPAFSASEVARRRYEPQPFAEEFCQPNLTAAPGAKWAYSNCGYVLLGLILERVTGQSFEALLHDKLLSPLGMTNTGMNHNDLVRLGGAAGYVRHAGPRLTPGPYIDQDHIFAAGAMYSTVEDLFRWNRALSSDGVLSKEIRNQVFTPGLSDWGYGWFVRTAPMGGPRGAIKMAEMRGDMPGNYFAWILRYPEPDDAIITLRNVYGSTEGFEANLQAILLGGRPKTPSRSAKDVIAHTWFAAQIWLQHYAALVLIFMLFCAWLIWLRARQFQSADN